MINLINANEKKIITLYTLTTVILYCAFWIGYYFSGYMVSLALSAISVFLFGMIYAVFNRKAWAPVIFVFIISTAVGLSVSAFFKASEVVPSRFFGLVLLIMLGYKTTQAYFGGIIKSKKLFYIFLIISLILELIACIAVGLSAYVNGPLLWQIFFALVICFFYSCAQITLRKNINKNFWKNAAISYLLGFVFIFLLIVLLIISAVTEDGGPLEFLFEGVGQGIADTAGEIAGGRTQAKKVNQK